MDESDLLAWLKWGVVAIMSTVTAALGTLWKLNETRNAKDIGDLRNKLEECETKHQAANAQILTLSISLAEVRAKIGFTDKKKPKVEE